MTEEYRPSDWGKKEEELLRKFHLQKEDAKQYFFGVIKPRLDRSYKLYSSYGGDRQKEIKRWQANIFVPFTQGVVETLMPRILDARPDLSVMGRNEDDDLKAPKLQNLLDYTWEINSGDSVSELVTKSSVVYGTGFIQTSWKKDERTYKFLRGKDITAKKPKWVEKSQVYFDAPCVEWVDNYSLLYDWHNVKRESKQYWLKRLILTGEEIKRKYPNLDKKRLKQALNRTGEDLTNWASIRFETKLVHEEINKGSDRHVDFGGVTTSVFTTVDDHDLRMHEVYEWWRPFDDEFAVMVNNVPVLKGATMPSPYDHKEAPFIEVPFLKLPNEFEGLGVPLILESPQILLNTIKNQRVDSTTLSIHKMWIVNPLANVNKDELVSRPFGIIYSTDPNGAREIEFSATSESAYREEELLKADMRYGVGIDDSSMGVSGGAQSATEVRHLRESTLERVRLFINHLGDAYGNVLRHWISMYGQFYTKELIVRIVGDDGATEFPFIEKDDLMGEFDFKATVIPSIAGMNELQKKQDMDLFQLFQPMEWVDQKKLASKILHRWNWNIQSISKEEKEMMDQQAGMPGAPAPDGAQPPGGAPMPPQGGMPMPPQGGPTRSDSKGVSSNVAKRALAMMGGFNKSAGAPSPFGQMSAPVNLLQSQGPPPTPKGVSAGGGPGPSGQGGPGRTTNTRGLNRKPGGKVNTNVNMRKPGSMEDNLMNRAFNPQR